MSEQKPRRYNVWAGDPNGCPENKTRCVESVASGYLFYQCQRKRGFGENGLYCKQHAKRHPAQPEKALGVGGDES